MSFHKPNSVAIRSEGEVGVGAVMTTALLDAAFIGYCVCSVPGVESPGKSELLNVAVPVAAAAPVPLLQASVASYVHNIINFNS